jgi:hypothetical protein
VGPSAPPCALAFLDNTVDRVGSLFSGLNVSSLDVIFEV